MTTLQTPGNDNPIAHLTDDDIEQLGRELDAIRERCIDSRGERDARLHPQGSSRPSASSSSAAAPCCCSRCSRRRGSSAPPACRSPRSWRTWRSATTSCTASGTGCATRRSTPPPGSGTTRRPPDMWKHSHNELHHTYTNVHRQGQRPRLRHHARRRGPALDAVLPRRSRCGTSSTPASSSTASRPTTSSSASTSRARRTRTEVPAPGQDGPRQDHASR